MWVSASKETQLTRRTSSVKSCRTRGNAIFFVDLQGCTPGADGCLALMRLEAPGFLDLASSILARVASQVKKAEWQQHSSGGLCNLLLACHRPFTCQPFTNRVLLQKMQCVQQTAIQPLSLALLLSQPQRKHIG